MIVLQAIGEGIGFIIATMIIFDTLNIDNSMGYIILISIINAILGLIPAAIAHKKGRSFFTWYFYGYIIFIVAIIHSIAISKNDVALKEDGMKKCPYCGKEQKQEQKGNQDEPQKENTP